MSSVHTTPDSLTPDLLEFQPGAKQIVARRREYDTRKFMLEYKVIITLHHPIKPG